MWCAAQCYALGESSLERHCIAAFHEKIIGKVVTIDVLTSYLTENHMVLLDGEPVPYRLEKKLVKNINMRIRPETGLVVSASPSVSITEIEQVLWENRARILMILHQFAAEEAERKPQYPVHFEMGESVLYLGEYYTLIVENGRKASVQVETGKKQILLVVSAGASEIERERVFTRWWKITCERAVRNLCRAVYPIFKERGVAFPKEIRFRRMVSQWGNCRPERGILTFNDRLLAASPRGIEYVVMHEFTHFLYPNHGKEFYRFLEKEIPDWKQVQEQLQKTVDVRI